MATNNNSVDFILDGEEYFTELRRQLRLVRDAVVNNNTYVRLAFWMFDSDTQIGPPGAKTSIKAELASVALSGHKVDIILWKPTKLQQKAEAMCKEVYEMNQSVFKSLNNTVNGNIRVYLEEYNGYVGSSTHQKITICSINGQRSCLVGGINTENNYYSNVAHDPIDVNFWHDTAVCVQGPATDEIEAEWVRRWSKSKQTLHNNNTVQNNFPAVGGAQVNVSVATTNTETKNRVTAIRDQLVEAIGSANNYVYLENYAVCDPAIITALRLRKTQNPALEIIIVVPYDIVPPYNYLMRQVWLKLGCIECTDITDNSRLYTRVDRPIISIKEETDLGGLIRSISSTFKNKWLENDGFCLKGNNHEDEIHINDVIRMTTPFRLYTPVKKVGTNKETIYVHSKLALIDDEILVVGSSNWTYRSMVYDGEISIIIRNQNVVTNARNRLFNHYCAGITPGNWRATANANEAGFGAAPDNSTQLIPLPLDLLSRDIPDVSGNFTWY